MLSAMSRRENHLILAKDRRSYDPLSRK